METKKKIKRPNSKDTNYENEQSCENKSLVAPCVIGHIDYGFGFYFPDLGLAMPEPPISVASFTGTVNTISPACSKVRVMVISLPAIRSCLSPINMTW